MGEVLWKDVHPHPELSLKGERTCYIKEHGCVKYMGVSSTLVCLDMGVSSTWVCLDMGVSSTWVCLVHWCV